MILKLSFITIILVSFAQKAKFQEDDSPPDPRVVTDLRIIRGRYGIHVDYSYNETGYHQVSVPGCPQSIDGYPWIYYMNPKRCFLAGERGPCKRGEVLMSQFHSTRGTCICKCLVDDDRNWYQLQGNWRYAFCTDKQYKNHVQIYDKEEKRCYNNYETGHGLCGHNELIAEWSKFHLKCLPKCENGVSSGKSRKRAKCASVPKTWSAGVPGEYLVNEVCANGYFYSRRLHKCSKLKRLTFVPGY